MCIITKVVLRNNEKNITTKITAKGTVKVGVKSTGTSVTSFSRLLLVNNNLKPKSISGNYMYLYDLIELKTVDNVLITVGDYGWN